MKKIITVTFILIAFKALSAQTKASEYVQFDDRKNIVHGVYLGFNLHYGEIDKHGAVFGGFKLAYVANQQIEVGLAATGFFSEKNNDRPDLFKGDKTALMGGYAGIHIEPILFGKRFISVSFPVLVGGGVVGYSGNNFTDDYELLDEDLDGFFIVEPGINILYNFSRFTQLETGIRYRFTSKFDLLAYDKNNLNGFSIGAGLKIGIFNMGRKKKIKDNF